MNMQGVQVIQQAAPDVDAYAVSIGLCLQSCTLRQVFKDVLMWKSALFGNLYDVYTPWSNISCFVQGFISLNIYKRAGESNINMTYPATIANSNGKY